MDLFSRFPESNTQGQILSKINDDLIDSDRFEMQESKEDINPQGNLRFESLQKVNSLRKRNLIMMIILLSLILFFSYIIPNILINISLICEKAKQETGPVCPFNTSIKSPVFILHTNIL